jgi:large subunit ribosomal protein L9
MHVILLERIANLGQMGDEVRVRDGFARNFLLPQGKALRANETNRKRFESQRAQLEARNLERRNEASAVAEKLDGQSFVIVRQAAETGQLYGSVTPRDLSEAMTAGGFTVSRSQVQLGQPIKTIGLHAVTIVLHPEVSAVISANVARSPDEAERQARGEDLTVGAAEAAETAAGEEIAVEVETAPEPVVEDEADKG